MIHLFLCDKNKFIRKVTFHRFFASGLFIYLFGWLVGCLLYKKKKKVSHSFLYSTCGFIYLFIFFLLLLLLILKCSFINCKVFFMQFISTHAALFLTSICHTLIYAHFSPDFFPPYDLFIFYVKYLYTIHWHFFFHNSFICAAIFT